MSTNTHETEARNRKAVKLAAAFIERGEGTDLISKLDDRGWHNWAGFAHVNDPSPTTRMLVMGLVANHYAAEKAAR